MFWNCFIVKNVWFKITYIKKCHEIHYTLGVEKRTSRLVSSAVDPDLVGSETPDLRVCPNFKHE
jgi:hypothetical protein